MQRASSAFAKQNGDVLSGVGGDRIVVFAWQHADAY